MNASSSAPSIATADPNVADAGGPSASPGSTLAALDMGAYAVGPAGEAWALMARLLFLHGKPRLPTIAAELDLHPGQAICLRLLDQPRPMGELAGAMHCDNSNITGIVDRLEERGLVERQPASYDRRVKLIAPTPGGTELREELNRRFAVPPESLTRLSAEDLEELRAILARALEEPAPATG